APFKTFFDTQTEKRNLEKAKARAGLEQSLNKKLASLDTVLAESFGSADGDKALALIKKGKALKSQLSSKTNDEIQIFVGEAEAFLAATKRRQDFQSKITLINERLATVVAENFGTDKGNQALAFIQENKAALANIASTANEKFNELMQKSQALISTGANVSEQPIDVSPPKTIPSKRDEPSSTAPKGWRDLVVFPDVDGNPSVPLKSEKGEEIFSMFDRSGDIEKIARGCADDLKAGRKLNECFGKSLLDEYVYKAHKSYLRKKEEEKAAAKMQARAAEQARIAEQQRLERLQREREALAKSKAARDKRGRNGFTFNIHKSELKSRGFQCIEEFGYAPTCTLGLLGSSDSVTVWVADDFVDRIVGLTEKYTQTGFDRVKNKLSEKYELIV
ncbi:MAG: hypothetical protein VW352_09535, partial [Gammaproteobacteria bacterium]